MTDNPAQPLRVQISRWIQALDQLGRPLGDANVRDLANAGASGDAHLVAEVRRVLDPLCVAVAQVSPESGVGCGEGPVALKLTEADGSRCALVFGNVRIDRNSWIDLRMPPCGHTNPVLVIVESQPIRPSRHSAEGCLKFIEQRRNQKEKLIAPNEMQQAKAACDHARRGDQKVMAEALPE